MTANSDTSWIPRYLPRADVVTSSLDQIPYLVRVAWDSALHFPETGGEGIEDLIEDIKEIVARETARLGDADRINAEASTAARHATARAVHAVRAKNAEEEQRLERLQHEAYLSITALTAETLAKGVNPRGCFVYMLWERKSDKKPIYVGKSTNLFPRIGDHMRDPARKHRIGWVTFIRCDGKAWMDKAERKWIRHYQPVLNIQGIEAMQRTQFQSDAAPSSLPY